MKQLLVLSGKGGTGKTTVASALIALSRCKAFADCDVDAPNLHLILSQPSPPKTKDFFGLGKAKIDRSKCMHCGLCEKNCHFEAISQEEVNFFACEGCGVCVKSCPAQAVTIQKEASGSVLLYKGAETIFSTASLKIGSGASGKLVTEVKQQLQAEVEDAELAVIDGSPGIGCPVIASMSGVSMALLVAEPTVSGLHDIKRIVETARQFGVDCAVCINKYDINLVNTQKIECYCGELEIPVVGKIPYDETAAKAVNQGQSIAAYPDSPAGMAVVVIWNQIQNLL